MTPDIEAAVARLRDAPTSTMTFNARTNVATSDLTLILAELERQAKALDAYMAGGANIRERAETLQAAVPA